MNLATYFAQAVGRFPDAPALVDDKVRWSYRELYEECVAVAANMQRRGLFAGEHVMVFLKN
jgi:non-ribosomal peptide synthetase component E (peptide arylation enzyme)